MKKSSNLFLVYCFPVLYIGQLHAVDFRDESKTCAYNQVPNGYIVIGEKKNTWTEQKCGRYYQITIAKPGLHEIMCTGTNGNIDYNRLARMGYGVTRYLKSYNCASLLKNSPSNTTDFNAVEISKVSDDINVCSTILPRGYRIYKTIPANDMWENNKACNIPRKIDPDIKQPIYKIERISGKCLNAKSIYRVQGDTPWGHSTFMTNSKTIAKQVENSANHWRSKGIAFSLPSQTGSSMSPFKQYWKAASFNHFYTAKTSDINYVLKYGWKDSNKLLGYVYDNLETDTLPIHRFNKIWKFSASGVADIEHYYTIDINEAEKLQSSYQYDGVVGYACN